MRKEVIRQTDFTSRELPKTRMQQFFDVIKHQKLNMVKVAMLQTVFNAPLMVWAVLYYLLLAAGPSSPFQITVFAAIALAVCITISDVGLVGSFSCMKKIAYADGGFASSSFFMGLKEEWKKGIVFGFLHGLVIGVSLVGLVFFISVPGAEVIVRGFGLAMLLILSVTGTMMNYYSLAQSSCYSNTMGKIIKNSLLMSLMRFPKHFLLFLLHPGVIVGAVIGSFCIPYAGEYVGIGVLVLFSFLNSFGILAWMLFTLTSFDKFINKENYPDYVNKGLYKERQEN